MKKKIFVKVVIYAIVAGFLFFELNVSLAQKQPDSQSQNSKDTITSQNEQDLQEQLWNLVRSLRQLRSDYYQKQSERMDEINRLRQTNQKLEAEAEELRRNEEESDESLSVMRSDIRKLQSENKKNTSMKSVVEKKLNRFVGKQKKEIEVGIPYRKDERIARLEGIKQTSSMKHDHSTAAVLGRIWSFSQEEMRIARSGETLTDLISIEDDRRQHARIFRVGHQVLGYITERDEQTGIWLEGIGWKRVKRNEAEAVKSAVDILDRRSALDYVRLPVKFEKSAHTNTHSRD